MRAGDLFQGNKVREVSLFCIRNDVHIRGIAATHADASPTHATIANARPTQYPRHGLPIHVRCHDVHHFPHKPRLTSGRHEFFLLPVPVNARANCCQVALLKRIEARLRSLYQCIGVSYQLRCSGVPIADHVLQQVAGQPRLPCIDQYQVLVERFHKGFGCLDALCNDIQRQRGGRTRDFEAFDNASDLDRVRW